MLANLLRRRSDSTEGRSLSWPDYLQLWQQQFSFNGVQYVVPGSSAIGQIVADVGEKNPIVAACVSVRLLVFAEARFRFQAFTDGRPGNFYGTPALGILERPYGPGSTTGDLLARMEMDASHYGNCYHVRSGGRLVRLDPTRVKIVTGAVNDTSSGMQVGDQLVGYALLTDRGDEAGFWLPGEVSHYRPLPDRTNPFRGVSWLNAVLPDVVADGDLTDYKRAFLRNGATPSMVVMYPPEVTKDSFESFKAALEAKHTGAANAARVLHLGGGADVKTVGSTFDQLAMKATQGHGETRIASAAGVPAAVVGISEGLAGSALNSGNYGAARRRLSDGTIRPLWRSAAGALSTLTPPPDAASRLWYDDRDVPFCQEDVLDSAEILSRNATTVRTLVDGGFDPDTVVDAVVTGDMTRLVHTGKLSVQLQSPGAAPQRQLAAANQLSEVMS